MLESGIRHRASVVRTVRTVAIAFIVMLSTVLIGALSRDARAVAPVVYVGYPGYAGPNAIYLTPTITSDYKLQRIQDATSQLAGSNNLNIANGITMTVGQDPATNPSGLVMYYVYDPLAGDGSGAMKIYIPVSAAGAGMQWVQARGANQHLIWQQELAVGINGAGDSGTHVDFQASYNAGVNVTGPFDVGQSPPNQNGARIILDAIGLLPEIGWAIGGYSLLSDLAEGVAAPPVSNPGVAGVGTATEYFAVTGGKMLPYQTENVFASQGEVIVQIPKSEFVGTHGIPQIAISVANIACNSCGNVFQTTAQASTITKTLLTFPAVTMTGQVTQLGLPYANHVIDLLTTTDSGVYVDYQVKTDQNGYYTFYAQPYRAYTVSANYQTPFGAATASNVCDTPLNTGAYLCLPLVIPSLHGTVKDSTTNVGLPGATVTITNSAGAVYKITTDASGHYGTALTSYPWPNGPYKVTALAKDYNAASPVTEYITGNFDYGLDFSLNPTPPDFMLSNCGGWSTFTYSSGYCAITATSVGKWIGTINLVATMTPNSNGAYITAGSTATLTLTADGSASFVVYFNTGSLATTYTVTVTGTSGSLSHTTTFYVHVSNPPPPPTCPPTCPT